MKISFSCMTCAVWLLASSSLMAIDPASLPPVGCHPDGASYYGSVMLANGLHQAGEWLEFSNDWGTAVAYWGSDQFNTNGYPRYLRPGRFLRSIAYGLHNDENRDIVTGQFILTWQGDADIRYGGTLIPGKSNCGATGRAVNGRRAYLVTNYADQTVTVMDINTNSPVTSIQLWLPDPANPTNSSLEGQLWHPRFLERLGDRDWGLIRMMNLQEANANPQQDWVDRCRPGFVFMNPVLNAREPAPGIAGNRGAGMAFEFLVDLCNRTTNDLWICVPHLATDAFVTNLARVIRFGSDGINPYTNTVASPTYPPLSTNLRVFIEFSNEIWNNGYSFPQGDWAEGQATALGITRAQFNARKFCNSWRIFQSVFGGTSRLVRVAATFTAVQSYTASFLGEMKTFGSVLTPAVEPDVIAGTTYFGNGIQDWVHQKAQDQAGSSDPWFYTGAMFGSPARPVSLPAADPYWTSAALERHIDEAYNEWTRTLLAGDAREGGGPDAVGLGGGFDPSLADIARTNFASPKPLIAYEGGPSIYTDYLDGGDVQDDGITQFMVEMNRRVRMREVYEIHLNMAKSKGLWMHMPFTLCSAWGKFGQWGHLEFSSQAPALSPKYGFILDWASEMAGLRNVEQPLNAAPSFATPYLLPTALARQPYTAEIAFSGGNGSRSVKVIGRLLASGLGLEIVPADPDRIRITGTPSEPGYSYIYLRIQDQDGDPAWRIFTLPTVGGVGTVLESNFAGTNPARNLPWTNVHVIAPSVVFTGWNRGAGIVPQDGNDGIFFSVNAPADEASSTLSLAIADQEYLGFTLRSPSNYVMNLAGASCRVGLRRLSWHAPREYAFFTSIGGFTNGTQVFTTQYHSGDTSDLSYTFNLPTTAVYRAISGPLEFRIYGYSGQYSGHQAELIDFKVTSPATYCIQRIRTDADADGLDDIWEQQHFASMSAVQGGPQDDFDGDGVSNLDEYLAGTNPAQAASLLRFSGGTNSPSGIVITWPSATGAVYAIESRPSLSGDLPWTVQRSRIAAAPPVNVFTAQVSAAPAFYRVVLESPP